MSLNWVDPQGDQKPTLEEVSEAMHALPFAGIVAHIRAWGRSRRRTDHTMASDDRDLARDR